MYNKSKTIKNSGIYVNYKALYNNYFDDSEFKQKKYINTIIHTYVPEKEEFEFKEYPDKLNSNVHEPASDHTIRRSPPIKENICEEDIYWEPRRCWNSKSLFDWIIFLRDRLKEIKWKDKLNTIIEQVKSDWNKPLVKK